MLVLYLTSIVFPHLLICNHPFSLSITGFSDSNTTYGFKSLLRHIIDYQQKLLEYKHLNAGMFIRCYGSDNAEVEPFGVIRVISVCKAGIRIAGECPFIAFDCIDHTHVKIQCGGRCDANIGKWKANFHKID